jgi:hypothetical protein
MLTSPASHDASSEDNSSAHPNHDQSRIPGSTNVTQSESGSKENSVPQEDTGRSKGMFDLPPLEPARRRRSAQEQCHCDVFSRRLHTCSRLAGALSIEKMTGA